MRMFKDRQSAGKLLAKRLVSLRGAKSVVVLGIPRGGVVVAKEIAEELKLPLDVAITRKVGDPYQKELSLGAIDPDGKTVWDIRLLDRLNLGQKDLADEVQNQIEEIKRRESLYKEGKPPLDVKRKKVILVDDGIATGATILSAILYLRRHGARKIIVAVPVASRESLRAIEPKSDEVIILYIPEPFAAVGQFYQHFEPVTDKEVIQLLKL